MKYPNGARSRLLIRLAQVISESKYPVSDWRRRAHGPTRMGNLTGPISQEEVRTEEIDSIQDPAWKYLEGVRIRFESELAFADSYLATGPPSSQIQLLLGNCSELRKLAVLQRFIERAYSYRLRFPREGLQITRDVITWTKSDPSALISIVNARALMEHGNLLRILGDPDGAYAALAEAAAQLGANQPTDPLDLARHQELLGSLEIDCGNFTAASDHLKRALRKVRRWGDPYTLQRTLAAAGNAALLNNNLDEAGNLLDEAMRMETPDSFLLRCAAFNRLLVYFLSGSPQKAYQALLRLRGELGVSWLNDAPQAIEMRAQWVEGQILSALRSYEDSIGILRKAREFAIRLGMGCVVCHISLDLALAYIDQERHSDVQHELAFALTFCSERKPLEAHGRQAMLHLLGSLHHRGRLEAAQLRSTGLRLETLVRAPLQMISKLDLDGIPS